MASTSTYHLHDRLLDGRLGPMLRAWKAQGMTVESMTFELRSEHDFTVTTSTVHRWLAIAESETQPSEPTEASA